jgi:large subunit ribosomal protein L4
MAEKKVAAARKPAARRKTKPEGASVEVVNAENQKVADRLVSPDVFGAKINSHLLYEAVRQYRAGGRAGTHKTKTRAMVSGTGKKPWKQKGTGRARVGEARNPLWRHGGTTFGPVPRDYSYSMPRKARAAALRAALSQCLKEGSLKVVEGFGLATPKTKDLVALLARLGVAGKAVIVDSEPSDALLLSGRNVPHVKVVDESHLTVYDVLDCKTLLVSQDALGRLEERLAR